MLSGLKKRALALATRVPWVRDQVTLRELRQRFPVDWALIQGTHRNPNRHPSILHFSVNKAATQYVKNLLKNAEAAVGAGGS